MWYLRDRLSYLRDQRGIETLEWILIGGVIVSVAVSTFSLLAGGLNDAVTSVANFIKNKALL